MDYHGSGGGHRGDQYGNAWQRGHGRGRGRGRGGRRGNPRRDNHSGGGGWNEASGEERGRGNRRGRRGHQHERDYGDSQPRERPPPGLKGRDIGMWYAQRSKKQTKEHELQNRPYIQMDQNKERNISKLLMTIRSGDTILPQPSRSYKDPFDSEGSVENESQNEGIRTVGRKTESISHNPNCSQETPAPKSELFSDSRENKSKPGSSFDFSADFIPIDSDDKRQESRCKNAGSDGGSNLQSQNYWVTKSCFDRSESTDSFKFGFSSNRPSGCKMTTGKDGASVLDNWEDFDETGSKERKTSTRTQDCIVIDSSDGDSGDNQDDADDEDISEEDLKEIKETQESMEGEPSDSSQENDTEDEEPEFVTGLYHSEEDQDSEFMAEFYENIKANRKSFERLQDIDKSPEGLQRIPALDEQLKNELHERITSNSRYKRMLEFRKKLPSFQQREVILRVIRENQVTVISGETGCGKTTQVAQFILDDYIEKGDGSLCHIGCTQPRRISAISVAERVAEERGETCGAKSAGYQIRLEARIPRSQGSILYCTTGIMLKWLVGDSWLARTSHVILDEIHERDLQSDFLMIILRDLIKIRPDLKLILMSATLNAEQFSVYFGNCPMLNIPGFTYPVKEYTMEDIVEITRYRHHDPPQQQYFGRKQYRRRRQDQNEDEKRQKYLSSLTGRFSQATVDVLRGMNPEEIDLELAAHLVDHIVRKKGDGAILVFMPGWEQIKKLNDLLSNNPMMKTGRFIIIPLHSLMPTINQKQVFERPPPGVRKIVIATNIAETSITIEDVVYVVDCGKIKMKNFDPEHNISTLQPEWVSRANARQRRGRAGRVQPGECYHMYTEYQEKRFDDYQLPEMLRTQLEELCLQIKLLKLGKIGPFVMKAMEPPSIEALHSAITNLRILNALDRNEELTPLGFHLAKMPVDPHTGKMLLFAAMFCCLDPVLTIAASLSFKDAFYIPMGKEALADKQRLKLAEGSKSDHVMLVNAYKGWERACSRGTARQYCYDNFLSMNTLKMLQNMRKQFASLLFDMKFVNTADPRDRQASINSNNVKLLKAIICAGLYPNVARSKPGRRKPGSKKPVILQTNTENSVHIHPKSVNSRETEFESMWFIYHLKMKTAKIYLYDSSMVSPYPLLFFGGTIVVRKDHGQDCIIVDDWIVFRSSRRIAGLVKELREELDRLLQYKVRHPGVTNWASNEKEGALMHAILDLITTEEHSKKY